MSKTIIIDGVNITECENRDLIFDKEHYCTEIEYDDGSPAYTCEERPNCYFKQLKRLQKENEEMKKYQYTQEYLQSEIEKRQKALEEIKEIIEFRFKTAYMTLGFKETDKIIEDIEKIANEVLNDN